MKKVILIGYFIAQCLIIFLKPLEVSFLSNSWLSKTMSPINTLTQHLNFTQNWSFYTPIYFKQLRYDIKIHGHNNIIKESHFPILSPEKVRSYSDLKKYEIDRYLASYNTPYYLLAITSLFCKENPKAKKILIRGKYRLLPDTQNNFLNNFKEVIKSNLPYINEEFVCN